VALLLWRDMAAIATGRTTTLDPAAITTAFAELRNRWIEDQARFERKLTRLAGELDTMLDELAVRVGSPDRRLHEALLSYRQASADMRHLGLPDDHASSAPALRPATVPKSVSKPRKPGGTPCPVCGGSMVKRWARTGPSPGSFFLGCSGYPACNGSRSLRTRRP
jgi:hypothetical protein